MITLFCILSHLLFTVYWQATVSKNQIKQIEILAVARLSIQTYPIRAILRKVMPFLLVTVCWHQLSEMIEDCVFTDIFKFGSADHKWTMILKTMYIICSI
jgi:hypothetical protein